MKLCRLPALTTKRARSRRRSYAEFDHVPAPVVLAALGAIEAKERQRVMHHILSGCTQCESVLDGCTGVAVALASLLPALPPSQISTRRVKKRARRTLG